MYVEDTGAGDGDVRITVDGEEYTAEANYDLDGNGVDETVSVMIDDGFMAYTDEDADGDADVMRTLDQRGNVLGQARFDEAAGQWVEERPDSSLAPDDSADSNEESMVLDTPQGDRRIGPPTEDTNNDGKADTAILDTDSGQMMVTDVDGDGSADQVVEIGDSGEVTVAKHTGDGEWTVVEQGGVDGQHRSAGSAEGGRSATEDSLWDFPETEDERDSGNGARSSESNAPDEGERDAAADALWV